MSHTPCAATRHRVYSRLFLCILRTCCILTHRTTSYLIHPIPNSWASLLTQHIPENSPRSLAFPLKYTYIGSFVLFSILHCSTHILPTTSPTRLVKFHTSSLFHWLPSAKPISHPIFARIYKDPFCSANSHRFFFRLTASVWIVPLFRTDKPLFRPRSLHGTLVPPCSRPPRPICWEGSRCCQPS